MLGRTVMGDTPAGVTRRERPGDTAWGTHDDATLIAQSIRAPECFALLFDRHAPAIHSYVARRLGQDAADDLTAEVFLIAFQRRRAYNATYANARPWLYGIATNLVRRRRRDEVRLFRAIARSGENAPAESVAEQVTNRVAAQAIRGRLASALSGLSGGQRDVLLLTASGLSCAEVAVAIGVPLGTVASRLARARRKVRAELEDLNSSELQGE
jgi:RNA polymerase sigma factor (sigma-70 family)